MNIFPLEAFLRPLAENPWTYLVFGLIGFGFGYVLEISGFGNSMKLSAQFYFKDLTVLKVMFGAIVTAMVLIFLSASIGILDYNQVYVPETYLWPGIVGGLIMGVGFIVGGFCPGTSLVSAATFKVDGIFFALGVLFGIWAFGETVDLFWNWWNTNTYFGRLTLMDAFGLPTGVVVLLVVLMALFMFWGGEQLERIFGKRDLTKEPKRRMAGAAILVVIALAVLFIGEPTSAEKYAGTRFERQAGGRTVERSADEVLAGREVQIVPAELFKAGYNQQMRVVMLDVRPEADYNLYHIKGARNVPLDQIPALVPDLLAGYAPNRVIVTIGNDETAATQAWKLLVAGGVRNVYILEGGINNWIAFFGADDPSILAAPSAPDDALRYVFRAALGDRYESCAPDPIKYEELEFEPKIKLEIKRDMSGGGCG